MSLDTAEPQTVPARAFTWQGVHTVLVLELRQRVRSTRWKVALVAWFAIVALVAVLLPGIIGAGLGDDGGAWVFGLILLFVLGLGLVVSPTLSSTAINGDRNAGTLAILQVTMLGPAEIAVGKLLAGWLAALSFLAISLPFLIWGAVVARVSVLGFVWVLVVLALLLGVVCAIGLGFSALTTRTAGSSVLTYVAVASLSLISPVLFALSVPAVSTEDRVEVLVVPTDANAECVWTTDTRMVVHTERTWWLLAINPFVILADAAPQPPTMDYVGEAGPLVAIQQGVRLARDGEPGPYDECWSGNYPPGSEPEDFENDEIDTTPVWPWGLAGNLALGAGALWVATRRLTVPYTTLAPGVRVA